VIETDANRYALHKLRPDQLCLDKDNLFTCAKTENTVGPVQSSAVDANASPFGERGSDDLAAHQGLQFYMTNRAALDESYLGGFHKAKSADKLQNDRSYVYRISTLAHAHLTQVE
jgi:hypothetical protein